MNASHDTISSGVHVDRSNTGMVADFAAGCGDEVATVCVTGAGCRDAELAGKYRVTGGLVDAPLGASGR